MPANIKIDVETNRFTRVLLNQLGPRAIRSSVMAGIRVATRFLQKILRTAAPKRTGRTRRLILARRVRQAGPVFSGGVKRPAIFNILESGARPHEIVPRQKNALVFGGQVVARVRHPGIAARPFWERTARAGEPEALRIFGERFQLMIDKAQAKVR